MDAVILMVEAVAVVVFSIHKSRAAEVAVAAE
jgi:hypothetical protein